MIVVGIDPGLRGGMAKLEDRRCTAVTDVPTRKKFEGDDNNKQAIDVPLFAALLAGWRPNRIALERVQMSTTYGGPPIMCPACGKQKNGVSPSSAMNFGHAAGSLQGACEAYIALIDPTCELIMIGPGKWKNAAGIEGEDRKDKEASRQLALRLFPNMATYLARKMDDGRAEAMLIGLYGGFPKVIEMPAGGKSRRRQVKVQDALL